MGSKGKNLTREDQVDLYPGKLPGYNEAREKETKLGFLVGTGVTF